MSRPPARFALTFLAPVVLGLGVTACTTSPGNPAQTLGGRGTSPGSAQPALPHTASTQPSPRTGVNASTLRVFSPRCPAEKRWGTGPRGGSTVMSPSALYLARVGRHPCYDRVVFDINGPEPVGFVARYVPVVTADGSGKPVPVAGRAALEVTVRAPILGADSQGHQPWRSVPKVGDNLVAPSALAGWTSLRAVKYAGSFEGQSTLAVGVRQKRPFRMLVTSERSYRHVVLDISH